MWPCISRGLHSSPRRTTCSHVGVGWGHHSHQRLVERSHPGSFFRLRRGSECRVGWPDFRTDHSQPQSPGARVISAPLAGPLPVPVGYPALAPAPAAPPGPYPVKQSGSLGIRADLTAAAALPYPFRVSTMSPPVRVKTNSNMCGGW